MSSISTEKTNSEMENSNQAATRKKHKWNWSDYEGYLFISPWLIGFLIFTLGPMLASFGLSFTRWDMLTPRPEFIGLGNYKEMFASADWRQSCFVTLKYAIIAVPTGMIGALVIALMMNQEIKGITVFRTIYYLPAVTSSVAMFLLWLWVFNPNFGLFNYILGFFVAPLRWMGWNIQLPAWLADPKWSLPALIIMNFWGLGGGMIIYLAGLKGIPEHYYEAAELDGANWWAKFWNVTVPMLSPTIFFNLIMSIIGSFQVFNAAYIMAPDGGVGKSLLFYVLYIYQSAYQFLRFGYASAMAWVLFVVVVVLTLINFKLSGRWVHYDQS